MTRFVSLALLTAGALVVGASTAVASSISFSVAVDTAPLIPLAGTLGPFSLDFQLNGMGPNTAVVSGFSFGTGGATGSPSGACAGASGDLSTSVTLTDSVFNSEFCQTFTPGSTLRFDVLLTETVDTPTPDAFAFAILDQTLANLPTTAPFGDELLLVNIDKTTLGPADVQTFETMGLAAGVTAAVVPEPTSLVLMGGVLVAGAGIWRRALKRAARRL